MLAAETVGSANRVEAFGTGARRAAGVVEGWEDELLLCRTGEDLVEVEGHANGDEE